MKLFELSILALISGSVGHRHHHHHHHGRQGSPRRLNTYLVKFVDDYDDLAPELLRDDDQIIASLAQTEKR